MPPAATMTWMMKSRSDSQLSLFSITRGFFKVQNMPLTKLQHSQLPAWLTTGGTLCIMMLPLFMFYSRALSDITATTLGCFFLLHCAITRHWRWLQSPWVTPAAVLCVLSLISSLHVHERGALAQALCLPRLFLITAAAQNWILTQNKRRLVLGGILFVLALWLISQCWEQYFTGVNLTGSHPWVDGSLTGPFYKPRASFMFLMLFFPGIMPVVITSLRSKKPLLWCCGLGLLLLSVVTMILIGQRMGTVLMLFGLFLTALLIRQFRWPFVITGVCAAIVMALLPVISPATYAKLVIKFSDQLRHFSTSDYGQLFKKATIMTLNHPALGLGMDGFRHFCHESMHSSFPKAFNLPALESPAGAGCNIHPHNYYLQVSTTAGLPGLLAFCLMVVCWLKAGARGLLSTPYAQHTMLFVVCCVVLWPVTSTSALFTFPTAGWIFLFAGWMMAASAAYPGSAGFSERTTREKYN